jgi:hypothetical protein
LRDCFSAVAPARIEVGGTTMREQWASYRRVREAAEGLKAIIRGRYPDARFQLVRAADQQRSWHLWTMVNAEDPDEVGALVSDCEIERLVEERIPIHVIPSRWHEEATLDHARRRVS